ncbi:MAG: S1 RNA-binding domain-containing protein [Oscillospiraceae bacterium]
MIELGKTQKLEVVSVNQFGAYLNSKNENGGDDIFLSKTEMPEKIQVGDEIEVFVYKNSEDKLAATVKKPRLQLGETAVLNVAEITNIGAFLDWGLEKDLLLPFKEQTAEIKSDGKYLVALYVDNSGRLCATMKIYPLLSSQSPYKEKDRVQGTVYNINKEWGCFVAVDNKYHGLIYSKEMYGNIAEGDTVHARIKKIRQDGKLELSLREPSYKEIEGDSKKIMDALKSGHGKLKLNDSSSPELIKAEMGMSKGAFKRAVGRLLKEGAVKITDEGIETMWKQQAR